MTISFSFSSVCGFKYDQKDREENVKSQGNGTSPEEAAVEKGFSDKPIVIEHGD